MRRALLLALVAGCSGDAGKPPVPPGPPSTNGKPQPPAIPWSNAQWLDLEIHVPKEWSSNRVFRLDGAEVHFGGPGSPGKRPELIFGWIPTSLSLEAWFGETVSKFENSPVHTVRQKGFATVAGMSARYCVVETKVSREILFHFVGHGHRGFVRGLAPIEDYEKHAPVFEEAAARLRYSPK